VHETAFNSRALLKPWPLVDKIYSGFTVGLLNSSELRKEDPQRTHHRYHCAFLHVLLIACVAF